MKKLVFISLLFCLALLLPVKTFAQTPTLSTQSTVKSQPVTENASPQSLPLNTNPDVPRNLHTYTQSTFIEILATATCFVGGIDLLSSDGRCLGIDGKTNKIGYVESGNGGLMAVAGNMIGGTFNIPISSFQYNNYLASNFGITKTSYAALGQGVGFVGLKPVLQVWVVFRNLTYLLFVIVFIILGLGIMFRVNIDARTVITIQNQIPKIVIALILITFSYAIVGFLIDMMYLSMYLIVYLFHSNNLLTITEIDKNPFEALGGFGGVNGIAEPAAKSIGGAFAGIFDGNLGGGLGSFLTKVIGSIMAGSAGAGIGKMLGGIAGLGLGIAGAAAIIGTGGMATPLVIAAAATALGSGVAAGTTVGSLLGGTAGGIVGFAAAGSIINFIAFLIAYLIITIAILSSLFRVWIMLIKAYIFIILDVVFAPFWILGGILPGAPGGFGPWLRSLLANLAAFPTVLILFMIGKTIQEQTTVVPQNFVPPLIGSLGDNPTSAMANLIGLGLILIMPEAVNMTKAAFKAPEHKLAATIGRSLGVGQAVIGKPFGAIRGELFGKDALGAPKAGSEWAAKRLGGIGRVLTGGGITDKTGKSKAGFLPWQKKIEGGGTDRNLWGKQTKESKALTAKKETEAAEEKLKVAGMHAETQRIRDLGFDPLKHKEVEHEGVTHYQEKIFGGQPKEEAVASGDANNPASEPVEKPSQTPPEEENKPT